MAEAETCEVRITVLVDDLGQSTIGDPANDGDDPWRMHCECRSGWSNLVCYNLVLTVPKAPPAIDLTGAIPQGADLAAGPITITVEATDDGSVYCACGCGVKIALVSDTNWTALVPFQFNHIIAHGFGGFARRPHRPMAASRRRQETEMAKPKVRSMTPLPSLLSLSLREAGQ